VFLVGRYSSGCGTFMLDLGWTRCKRLDSLWHGDTTSDLEPLALFLDNLLAVSRMVCVLAGREKREIKKTRHFRTSLVVGSWTNTYLMLLLETFIYRPRRKANAQASVPYRVGELLFYCIAGSAPVLYAPIRSCAFLYVPARSCTAFYGYCT
jgi:hypothetical protein